MKLDVLEETHIDKLLVLGHKFSDFESASSLMQKIGLEYANTSKNEKMEASAISEAILKSKKKKKQKVSTKQLKVSKVWDALALDLFLGNIEKDFWLWEDSAAINLLDYWKSLDEQLAFMLVYVDPKTTLLNFIHAHENLSAKDLDALLHGWLEYNTVLLNFFYKNKDRSLLINSKQLKKNNAQHIEQLTKKIGLEVDTKRFETMVSTLETSSNDVHEEDDPLELFGESLFYEYPEVIELYEELQSVANIYDSEDMYQKIDVKDTFCKLVATQKEKQHLHVQHTEQVNKNNALQSRADTLQADNHSLKKKSKKIYRSKKSLKNKAKRLQKEQGVLTEENDLQLTQLHHVQEELEKHYLENNAIKSTIATLDKEKSRLSSELKKVKEEVNSVASKVQEEENDLLLTQLHHVQEELEKYYLENGRLKTKAIEKKRYYGAADRVKDQLSYKLGATMIERSKTFSGTLGLPFSLRRVYKQHKKDLIIKKAKNLPPIESYADAYDAQRVKGHLSYMLGQTMIKTMKNPLGIFVLPSRLISTHRVFKQSRKH